MKPEQDEALVALLYALRRHLWRQAIGRCWWRGLRLTAVLLAGVGMVHTLAWPLPFVLCAGVALAPPLLALIIGWWRGRPSLAHCAWLADHRFGGKSLLTSAWDLRSRPQSVDPASAHLLLSQANQAAADWHSRLIAHRDGTPPRQVVLSVSLGLVGLFLLSSPGALLPSTATSAVAADITAPVVAESLDEVRTPAEAGATAPVGPTAERTVPTPGNEQAGGKAATAESSAGLLSLPSAAPERATVAAGQQSDPLAATLSPATAATPAAGGNLSSGNDQAGTDSDEQSASRRTPPANPTIRYFDIARRAGEGAQVASNESEELSPVELTPRPLATAAASPAERGVMPYETVAGPALRRYVADYFQELKHD